MISSIWIPRPLKSFRLWLLVTIEVCRSLSFPIRTRSLDWLVCFVCTLLCALWRLSGFLGLSGLDRASSQTNRVGIGAHFKRLIVFQCDLRQIVSAPGTASKNRFLPRLICTVHSDCASQQVDLRTRHLLYAELLSHQHIIHPVQWSNQVWFVSTRVASYCELWRFLKRGSRPERCNCEELLEEQVEKLLVNLQNSF